VPRYMARTCHSVQRNRVPAKRRTNGAGAVRQLPSGHWQARHRGPDGVMRPARLTFDTKLDAGAWLASQVRDVDRGTWAAPPAAGEQHRGAPTLRSYSGTWLDARDLKPRSRLLYRDLLDALVLPGLGDVELTRLTPTTVRNWHATLDPATPTRRAHAYSLLRSIVTTAVSDDLVTANPCRIRGAGSARTEGTRAARTSCPPTQIVAAVMCRNSRSSSQVVTSHPHHSDGYVRARVAPGASGPSGRISIDGGAAMPIPERAAQAPSTSACARAGGTGRR